jgi:putative hydrolase of the HAD superfamily
VLSGFYSALRGSPSRPSPNAPDAPGVGQCVGSSKNKGGDGEIPAEDLRPQTQVDQADHRENDRDWAKDQAEKRRQRREGNAVSVNGGRIFPWGERTEHLAFDPRAAGLAWLREIGRRRGGHRDFLPGLRVEVKQKGLTVPTDGLLTGIRAVAFDAVGTLITPDPPVQIIYQTIGQRHGSLLSSGVIRDRFRATFRAEEERDRSAGWRTDPAREVDRWRRIVATVLKDVTDPGACFRDLWDHFSRPAGWRCLPDAGPVLAELSRRGLNIGLASNFDSRLRSVVAGLPELNAIGPIVVSAEVGWRKPAAEFYAALVRACKCEPDEILLVGDDFENDYVGARTAGLRAALLDPAGRAPGEASRISGLTELVLRHSLIVG